MPKKATNKDERTKKKNEKISNIKTRNKNRAKGINKASRRAARSNVGHVLQQKTNPPCNQTTWHRPRAPAKMVKHAYAIFWQPRRAHQITVLSEYFLPRWYNIHAVR